ncbi:MAG: hypothetical protein LBD84_04710 [Campylobacteraceae bacterium]|jgi:hypothetical protein|nr:hypothetical protein [Campylobacteraceae bacterium]
MKKSTLEPAFKGDDFKEAYACRKIGCQKCLSYQNSTRDLHLILCGAK